jgi:hypothetical protein
MRNKRGAAATMKSYSEERRGNVDSPTTGTGAMHWIMLGLGGSIVALLVAYLVPSIIPAKSAATRL